jgi:glycosyltransferase involved in cell wall biosynthesis
MTDKKIKIFTLSDHPLTPSGVGTQTRYIIEGMLRTGKYQFISFGGLIKHQDYRPIKTEEFGDDWIIIPTDGYGTPEAVRAMLWSEKPDIVWFMTDPRFWGWLWQIEEEVRHNVPMVYYHVWDNYPYPTYNKANYDSNDFIATISKVTDDIVANVSPDVDRQYVPHAVNLDIFKPLEDDFVKKLRADNFKENKDKFVVFWNNRNARRKMGATLILWFKDFLERVGQDNAVLLMHTNPKDQAGSDLEALIKEIGLNDGQVLFSREKLHPENLAAMYNMVDCTINISDAEGFGLGTLESLSCGTPIIVNMTGGLQEQVTDGEEWFGVGLEPVSKTIVGSQEVPFIYEDRLSKEPVVQALYELWSKTKEQRKEIGLKGRKHVEKNYNFDDFIKTWDEIFTKVHKEHGSWETRNRKQNWTLEEVA